MHDVPGKATLLQVPCPVDGSLSYSGVDSSLSGTRRRIEGDSIKRRKKNLCFPPQESKGDRLIASRSRSIFSLPLPAFAMSPVDFIDADSFFGPQLAENRIAVLSWRVSFPHSRIVRLHILVGENIADQKHHVCMCCPPQTVLWCRRTSKLN